MILFFSTRDKILNDEDSSASFSYIFHQHNNNNSTDHQNSLIQQTNLNSNSFWIVLLAYPTMFGLLIPFLYYIFKEIAIKLNNFENYQTESTYQNHLIVKVFSFRFICMFSSLYYYAFTPSSSDSNSAMIK